MYLTNTQIILKKENKFALSLPDVWLKVVPPKAELLTRAHVVGPPKELVSFQMCFGCNRFRKTPRTYISETSKGRTNWARRVTSVWILAFCHHLSISGCGWMFSQRGPQLRWRGGATASLVWAACCRRQRPPPPSKAASQCPALLLVRLSLLIALSANGVACTRKTKTT